MPLIVPRRRLLAGLGATAAGCRPAAGDTGRANGPGVLDTYVLLMMENRSFDHVFGSLRLDEGRLDVDGLAPGHGNADKAGNWVAPVPSLAPCVTPDPPHGWTSSHAAFANGTNGGFVTEYQNAHGDDVDTRLCMAYQRRVDQPVSYALADGHALCQRWFSSLMTSTWPNRLYFHAASSMGVKGNDFMPGGYSMPSLWDRLDEGGVAWANYYTDLPTLALFGRADWADRTLPIDRFFLDVENGTLPRVVMLDPGASFNDDHPPHHPLLGQLFIGSVYEALARSAYWERCLFVVTYDEAGGFFDHVAPPTVPDERASEGFDQLGFRVPGLVMGPWVRPGVSDVPFDHTSALATILRRLGLPHLTDRDTAANDLGVLVDEDRLAANDPLPPVALPVITMTEDEIAAQCAAAPLRRSQPELLDLVTERQPGVSRASSMETIGWSLVERAARTGLLEVT